MRKDGLLLLICLPVLGVASSMSELVARAVPRPHAGVTAETPLAAVCPDGAVWIVWRQELRQLVNIPPAEQVELPDVGLFCRLIAADGSDIVYPMQIVKPTYGRYLHAPLAPFGFLPITLPDG